VSAPTLLRRDRRRVARERSVWALIGIALSGALLVLVVALGILTIVLPAASGGRALTVLTSSMQPALPPGTLIVVRPTPPDGVRVGDVLTYQLASGRADVVTHRVLARTVAADGSVQYTTQGDANPVPDPEPVSEAQVVGTLWYSLPLIGWVNAAVSGDVRAIVIPAAGIALLLYAALQFALSARARLRRGRPGPRRAGRGGRTPTTRDGALTSR